METPDVTQRDSFTSKIGIIAAIAGSVVGLGNIWKFPYITGIYGGGAFVLVYLLCIVIIGMPVMLSEFVMGRKAQRNAIGSFKKLAPGTLWFHSAWGRATVTYRMPLLSHPRQYVAIACSHFLNLENSTKKQFMKLDREVPHTYYPLSLN
jgi:SNF family Na+-dependent transporter